MFLALKRGLPFCLDCLSAHGAFGSGNEGISSQVRRRVLIAQAMASGLKLLTDDADIRRYDIATLW
jgi:hypothetical protein